ncbi:putative lanosterol 14-alpha demethylase [Mycena venus]|uniref:Putative lanosterol 14-alpha demethylase n=1 Tax=Mycena venus TaxID=2733690 RepID=A0A8H7DDM9_9AGAR|nr:putative lanosterol 14-alpha demethylase [Mycena venus]
MEFSTTFPLILGVLLFFFARNFQNWNLWRSSRADNIPHVPGHLLFGSTEYFTRRDDFLEETFERLDSSIFRFRVLFYNIVALRGNAASTLFFNKKSLSFEAGYRLMHGMAPEPHDVKLKTYSELASPTFAKRVSTILKTEYYERIFPKILDIFEETLKRNASQSFNAFDTLKPCIVRAVLHILGSETISESPESVEKMTNIIGKLSEGDSMTNIISCLTLFLFASFVETPPTISWIMIYLSTSSEWNERANREVQGFLASHCSIRQGSSVSQYLAQIPLHAWETDLPVLDAVIDETVRLTLIGAVIRRNVGEDFNFEGSTIRHGDFLTYPLADKHLDPAQFPSPHSFNPGHHLGVDTANKFWGFGGGRHPCLGKRSAYIIIKAFLVTLLTGYDYTIVDRHGHPLLAPPTPKKNSFHTCELEAGVTAHVDLAFKVIQE